MIRIPAALAVLLAVAMLVLGAASLAETQTAPDLPDGMGTPPDMPSGEFPGQPQPELGYTTFLPSGKRICHPLSTT